MFPFITRRFTPFNCHATTIAGPLHSMPRFERLVMVGATHHAQALWPGLCSLGLAEGRLGVVCDGPASPLNTAPHAFFPFEPGDALPLEAMDEAGFLSARTLFLVATKPAGRVAAALILRQFGPVACLMPLAPSRRQAGLLLPGASSNLFPAFPVDPLLFSPCFSAFLRAARQFTLLDDVAHVRGSMRDCGGTPAPPLDSLRECASRLMACLVAAAHTRRREFEVQVDAAHVLLPGACRVSGRVRFADGHFFTFDVKQDCKSPLRERRMTFLEGTGALLAEVDLDDEPASAIARVLASPASLQAATPLTLEDAASVLEVCDTARTMCAGVEAAPFHDSRLVRKQVQARAPAKLFELEPVLSPE